MKICLIIFWVLGMVSSQAQQRKQFQDSIKNILKDHAADTIGVNLLNDLGPSYVQVNVDSLLFFSQQALDIATKLHYKHGIADATKNICIYYRQKGISNAALDEGLKALKLFEELDDKAEMSGIYILLAEIYKDIGGEKLTEEYIQEGIDYGRLAYGLNIQLRDTGEMVSDLNVLGIIFRDWGKKNGKEYYYDSAYHCYQQAIAFIDKTGKGKRYLGRIYNNISQYFTEHHTDYKTGLDYLFKAVDFNKESNNISSLTFNYGNISDVYRKMGNIRLSLDYARKTVELAKQLNAPPRLQNAYNQLYISYRDNKQYDSALYYYIAYEAIGDSLLNIDKTKQIADMQTKYETAKKEAEIQSLNTINSDKNKKISYLGIGLALFALLAVTLLLLYRRVTKQKMLITQQSKQLETMMKELHHRVKNNLQIVSSLLSLQSYKLNDEEAIAAIRQSQQRVQAMSFIHQRLYKTEDLAAVNIKEYITDLAEALMSSYGYSQDNFDLKIFSDIELLDVDKALPLGLIINEIVTNAFKYAYKDIEQPLLQIMLTGKENVMVLSIKDNGKEWNQSNWKQEGDSFGRQLVNSLCRQLRARQELVMNNGTLFTFTIPGQMQAAS